MSGADADRHQVTDIAVRDTVVSDAVNEPMRAMILDILGEEVLTAGQVHARLADRGIDRTENTVRHHINELRDAGLVDVVRFEEGRGGTTKHYAANTIVLSYSLPQTAGPAIEEMVEAVEPEVEAALSTLLDEHEASLAEIVAGMQPCEHCRTQKYQTYVLLTVLRRAFVRAYHEADPGA
jgi:DNA-binding transcriptional ArsR family regulator